MEGKKRYLAPVSSKSVVQIIIDRLTGAIIEGELRFQRNQNLQKNYKWEETQ